MQLILFFEKEAKLSEIFKVFLKGFDMKKIIIASLFGASLALGLAGCSDNSYTSTKVEKLEAKNKVEKLDTYHKLSQAVKGAKAVTVSYQDPKDSSYSRHHFKDAKISDGGEIIFSGFTIQSGYEDSDLFYHVYKYRVQPTGEVLITHANYDMVTSKKIDVVKGSGKLGESVIAQLDVF